MSASRRPRLSYIFLSAPYKRAPTENVERAIDAANELALAGFYPFLPHLFHYWHERHRRSEQEWLALDIAWLVRCDALVRLPGESVGADGEVAMALTLGMPVYYGVDSFLEEMKREGWGRPGQKENAHDD